MNMSLIPNDQRAEWVRVIQRKGKEFNARAVEFALPTEHCRFYFDPNGLGIWIGLKSRGAREVFDTIKKEIFPSFTPDISTDKDGTTWAHFYYSEPWALSRLYVADHWVQLGPGRV
jgi:hypothetical protein